MPLWDEEATSDTTTIQERFYCVVCEEFFILSALAPTRCPICFTDARNIIGPIPVEEVDIEKLKRQNKERYGHAQRR